MIRVRQLASGVVHFASPEGLVQYEGSVFGSPVVAIEPPVATSCRATLRGQVIRIPDLTERGYQVTCKTCRLLAEVSGDA